MSLASACMKRSAPRLLRALALSALLPLAAAAQDAGSLAQYRIEPVAPGALIQQPGAPAATISSPSAWGANWGMVFAGAGYQNRIRYRSDVDDGAVGVGFGLGNSRKAIGLEVMFTSVSTIRSGLGERASLSFKAHRNVGARGSLAVGFENAVTFGDGLDGDNSVFVAAGYGFVRGDGSGPFGMATLTVGAGNGRFRSEDKVIADEDGIGVFGALAVRVIDQASLIGEWTGQDVAVGLSVTPIPGLPLTLTPALVDVASQAGDGTRFALGIGFGYSFF